MNRKCGWLTSAMMAALWSSPAAAAGRLVHRRPGRRQLSRGCGEFRQRLRYHEHDQGWLLSVRRRGYRFGNGLRAEAELGYSRQGFDSLQIRADGGLGAAFGVGSLNGATVRATGHVSALSLLANLWYDLHLGCAVKPYAGGGVGAARISATDVAVSGVTIVNGSDTVFAFQLGAGVGYEVFPAATLSVDYRYFQAVDPKFKDQVLNTSFRSEYHAHDIRLGVRREHHMKQPFLALAAVGLLTLSSPVLANDNEQ